MRIKGYVIQKFEAKDMKTKYYLKNIDENKFKDYRFVSFSVCVLVILVSQPFPITMCGPI